MRAAAYRAYSLAEIATAITNWKAALEACRAGKSYSIAGRQLTRVDEFFVVETLAGFVEEQERRQGQSQPRCFLAGHGGATV